MVQNILLVVPQIFFQNKRKICVVVTASALLEKYGSVADVINAQRIINGDIPHNIIAC